MTTYFVLLASGLRLIKLGWRKLVLVNNPMLNGEPYPLSEGETIWENNLYVVNKYVNSSGEVGRISLYRKDNKTVRDWRHLQRIKNEIAGGESWFAEIYPAQSKLVDLGNTYHLIRLTGHAVSELKGFSDKRQVSDELSWQRRFDSTEDMEAH